MKIHIGSNVSRFQARNTIISWNCVEHLDNMIYSRMKTYWIDSRGNDNPVRYEHHRPKLDLKRRFQLGAVLADKDLLKRIELAGLDR